MKIRIALSLSPLILALVFLPACAKSANEAAESDTAAESSEAAEPTPSEVEIADLDPDALPEIVARVNGQDVSKEELLSQVAGARAALARAGNAPPATPAFYRDIVDTIIGGLLLLEQAQTQGLEATAGEVDDRLTNIRRGFAAESDFEKFLDDQGTTEAEFSEKLKMEVSVEKYIQGEIVPQIEITESDERAFYDQNVQRMQIPEQVRVRHILVKAEETASADERRTARQKALDLRGQLEGGGDFATLAREHSEDEISAQNGGELPWIAPGRTVPPFEQAAFALAPGATSDVVESPFGFHIINLLERRESSTIPFEEARQRIRFFLQRQAVQARVQAEVDSLKSSADIEVFM